MNNILEIFAFYISTFTKINKLKKPFFMFEFSNRILYLNIIEKCFEEFFINIVFCQTYFLKLKTY